MKILFVFLLLGLALCDRKYFIYKDGNLQRKDEAKASIFGHLEIMNEGRDNYVELNGFFLGAVHSPFAFIFDLPKMNFNEGEATGECKSGAWDHDRLKLTGKYTVTVGEDFVKFEGHCVSTDNQKSYKIDFIGNSTKCLVYQPPEPAIRVMYLIDEPTSRYRPSHVLNFAYYDYPFLDVLNNCRFYLNNFGTVETEPKPGYAIVGKDGMHCGVIDREGTKFIHANPSRKEVTLTSLAVVDTFFRNGYVFKSVPCKGPHGY